MARRSKQAPPPSDEYMAERAAHREGSEAQVDPQLLPLAETVRTPKELDSVDYVVVGPKEVFGHRHGDVVSLKLTKDQAANLIEAGHIALAEGAPAPTEPVEPQAENVAPAVDDQTGQSPDETKE